MRASTTSDQLSAHSWHIIKIVSFIPIAFTSRTSCFLFLKSLAVIPQKKQLVLKENPSSDDQSTGLPLLDVLGTGSSWWVSFAI